MRVRVWQHVLVDDICIRYSFESMFPLVEVDSLILLSLVVFWDDMLSLIEEPQVFNRE